jgi:hypothetical protein
MIYKKRGIKDGICKTIREQNGAKLMIPCLGGLFETIKSFTKLADMGGKL